MCPSPPVLTAIHVLNLGCSTKEQSRIPFERVLEQTQSVSAIQELPLLTQKQ